MGRHIYRLRWLVVLAWLASAGVLGFLTAPADPESTEPPSPLPHNGQAPALRSEWHRRSFPSQQDSAATVVFERAGAPLTPGDRDAIANAARRIAQPGELLKAGDLEDVEVAAPRTGALAAALDATDPLTSPASDGGQAAVIQVRIPASFVTIRATRMVDHIRHAVASTPRPALWAG